jgi:hypothetical protein
VRIPTLLVLLAAFTFGAGCSAGTENPSEQLPRASSGPASPPPTLGGDVGSVVEPPEAPMDGLERPIAARLSSQVDDQGLTMEYLDCPDWNGKLPRTLACAGYFEGVTADVLVHLTRSASGDISFDAELRGGVLATSNLVTRLRSEGFTRVDCGDRAAYPTVVGSQLICSVTRRGAQKYVVATVTDRSGAVAIDDY